MDVNIICAQVYCNTMTVESVTGRVINIMRRTEVGASTYVFRDFPLVFHMIQFGEKAFRQIIQRTIEALSVQCCALYLGGGGDPIPSGSGMHYYTGHPFSRAKNHQNH